MGVWKAVVKYERGGTGKDADNVNSFYFDTDAPLYPVVDGSDPMYTYMTSLAVTLAGGLVSDAKIVQIKITDPAREGSGRNPEFSRSIGYNMTGGKAVAAGQVELKEVVIELRRNSVSGQSGVLGLRHVALEGEVVSDSVGNPVAPGIPAGVEATITGLNAWSNADRRFVMWSKNKAGVVRVADVKNFTYKGANTRDTTTHRKKKPSVNSPTSAAKAVRSMGVQMVETIGQVLVKRAMLSSPLGLALVAGLELLRPAAESAIAAAESYLALPAPE
jgi:hypothetical protein